MVNSDVDGFELPNNKLSGGPSFRFNLQKGTICPSGSNS